MSSIQDAILAKLFAELTQKLITDIDDTTKAGVIKIGELQGEPDPDVARISVMLFVNDPDQEIKNSGIGNSPEAWDDTIYETEIGGGIIWKRRFTVKCRCLFTNTKEDAATSRSIATTLKQRIEQTILGTNFGGISVNGARVSMGAFGDALRSEMVFSGGPPDSFDYHIKTRFQVLTSEVIGVN
jgi:hypothetical protein